MGIINVTPDSFSDGGSFVDSSRSASYAARLVEEGAAIIDVGGESARPGAEGIPVDEELRRVVPPLERIVSACPAARISIDTTKAEVAERALALGATMVNDISAMRHDRRMAEVVGSAGADVCLMHMRGTPATMQVEPVYEDVVSDVLAFLEERIESAVAAGIAPERICVDPGIGFGKTVEHNLQLVAGIPRLAELGHPVVIGASRKSFLGRVLGDPGATRGPLSAALAVATMAYERGASIFRVHDVREHVQALRAASMVAEAGRELELDVL
jgi:dihydropteroate synthase